MGEALAIGGKVMEAGGVILGGMQQKNAAKINAIKARTAAEAGKVRAIQVDAAYRDELNTALENIDAIRVAQNVSLDSPTAFALIDKAQDTNARARAIAVSNERMKALGLEGDAATTWSSANNYLLAGLMRGGNSLASAGQQSAQMMARAAMGA